MINIKTKLDIVTRHVVTVASIKALICYISSSFLLLKPFE